MAHRKNILIAAKACAHSDGVASKPSMILAMSRGVISVSCFLPSGKEMPGKQTP